MPGQPASAYAISPQGCGWAFDVSLSRRTSATTVGASIGQARVCHGAQHRASATLAGDVRQSKLCWRKRGDEALSDDLFVPKQLGYVLRLGLVCLLTALMDR